MANSLAKKLAIKSGQRVIVRRCPDHLLSTFKKLGAAFDRGTIAEVTLSFVSASHELDNACKEAIALTAPGGIVWVAYPKSDLSRDAVEPPFGKIGWRPVSTVSIDETWSALRFRPVEDVKPR